MSYHVGYMEAVTAQEHHPEPWIPSDTFGARLALIRQHLGAWNVARVALHCHVDDQTWRNWESGKSPRDYETITARIAAAVHCDVAWLRAGGPLRSGSYAAWDSNPEPTVFGFGALLRTVESPIGSIQLRLDLDEEHVRSFSLAH